MKNKFMIDKSLIQTALGVEKAGMAIRNARRVNVLTEEIYPADVAIKGQRIAYVGDISHCTGPETVVIDAKGKYIVPGLIDPHIHPEACKVPLTRLAQAMLPRGTTTIFAGLDDYWSLFGIDGVRFALDEAKKTPLRVIYHPYSRVPVTGFDPASTVAHEFGSEAIKKVLDWPETVGPMDMVIDWILGFDKDMHESMRAVQERGLLVHGHDTFEVGRRMQAFLTTGIRSDHVPFAVEEALQKLRAGMWVMFCDSPIARIMPDVIRALTETKISTRHATFCIDDMDSRDLFDPGHIDHQIRTAIASGLNPIQAVQMAPLNAAECHRMDHVIGSIAPGRSADILVVGDLIRFTIEMVVSQGELVVDGGKLLKELEVPKYPSCFFNTVKLTREVTPDDLVMKTDGQAKQVKAIALHIPPYNPMRFKKEVTLKVINGEVQPDPENDILYCAMVERHRRTGNIGLGLINGFNLNGGTIATSVMVPSNNITCLGSNKQDMAFAIKRVAKMGGGQVAVRDGKVIAEIPLPIGGILADVSSEEMADMERKLTDVVHSWGCPMPRPFFFLMFLEIVPLPDYALTEYGVAEFKTLKYIDTITEVIK